MLPELALVWLAALRPAWIADLPERPGRLYALGATELGASEGAALSRAADLARLAVVARLRATVQGRTRITTQVSEIGQPGAAAAGSGTRQARDEVSVTARAEDLPGLVVAGTFADPAAGSAFALAYLDLAQAEAGLAAGLEQVRAGRLQAGAIPDRRTHRRLRQLQADLQRLEAANRLLAAAGVGPELVPRLAAERAALAGALAARAWPPLDRASTRVGLRANLALPPGLADGLDTGMRRCGLQPRNQDLDLILELTFPDQAPDAAFIRAAPDHGGGVSYRLEARMAILDAGGTTITRTIPLQVRQTGTPEGMVDQFLRQFEARLPTLFAEALAESR